MISGAGQRSRIHKHVFLSLARIGQCRVHRVQTHVIVAQHDSALRWQRSRGQLSKAAEFGTLAGPNGRVVVPVNAQAFVMVGLCGGFTTFSTFSAETLALIEGGEYARATAYVFLSVFLCLLATLAGMTAIQLAGATRHG